MKRSREPEEASDSASDDQAHASTNQISVPVSKISHVEDDGDSPTEDAKMKCSLPPHKEPLEFSNYSDYESHYNQAHTNRCSECRKNFPSPHLLNLHIEEMHDAFIALKREKGEHTFSCFVEGCERKCMTPQKRRLHLIDKHLYPRNFLFSITRDGIDGRQSLLTGGTHGRRRASMAKHHRRTSSSRNPVTNDETVTPKEGASSKTPAEAPDSESSEQDEESEPDKDMQELTGAMSDLRFVPNSIKFGRKARGKTGFSSQ